MKPLFFVIFNKKMYVEGGKSFVSLHSMPPRRLFYSLRPLPKGKNPAPSRASAGGCPPKEKREKEDSASLFH